jgi:hypothetical protein
VPTSWEEDFRWELLVELVTQTLLVCPVCFAVGIKVIWHLSAFLPKSFLLSLEEGKRLTLFRSDGGQILRSLAFAGFVLLMTIFNAVVWIGAVVGICMFGKLTRWLL